MFRQVAPRYDLMNHVLSLNVDRYWRWRAVRRLTSNDPAVAAGTAGTSQAAATDSTAAAVAPVLDICTGTGDLALALRQHLPANVNVVGSDFCYAMLQIAQQKQAALLGSGKPDVTFVEADSQHLPFADDTFRAVTVAFGLRNVTDTDRGLREMLRVCRPGGQVLVLEFSNPRIPVFRQLYQFYFSQILPRIGQWFARNDKDAYRYLQKSVGQFPDRQQLIQRMTAAGMVDCRFTAMTGGVACIYVGFKPQQPAVVQSSVTS